MELSNTYLSKQKFHFRKKQKFFLDFQDAGLFCSGMYIFMAKNETENHTSSYFPSERETNKALATEYEFSRL